MELLGKVLLSRELARFLLEVADAPNGCRAPARPRALQKPEATRQSEPGGLLFADGRAAAPHERRYEAREGELAGRPVDALGVRAAIVVAQVG